MTTDLPEQRPEGLLIQQALKADGRSIRQVAPLAGISDARWRQLVKGSLASGDGHVTEQVAPAATLARMAFVVGVTPGQLTKAGRKDAAALLVRMHDNAPEATSTVPPPEDQADEIDLIVASKMTARQKLKAIRQVLQLRAQVEAEAAREQKRAPAQNAGASVERQS